MAEKLDYTIQIDEQEYDVTAADALHADLANQVEKALIVKESVRKNLNYKEPGSTTELKDIESLTVDDLQADIETPNTTIGVVDSRDTRNSENNGHSFAYKGDFDTTLEVVPSSGGVFTGPIYAPDIDADDGFNINKFQVTNYNSVDTVIRELKGFPVYEWTGTEVLALTQGNPPTMLPFKVIIYTGSEGNGWDNRANLELINSLPDGTTQKCTTMGKFFLINATNDSKNGGRILLGTYNPKGNPLCTYEELRVKKADNANTLGATSGIGSVTQPIYLAEGDDGGVATICYDRAGGTAVTLNGDKKFIDETATDKTETAASFYAPTEKGTTGYVLLSNGDSTSDNAPTWANQNTLSVKEAQNVTQKIGGEKLSSIFVYTDDDDDPSTPTVMTTQVKSAAHADSATRVTGYIGNQALSNIFVSNSSQVKSAARADSAANADKLYIYSAGGTGTAAQKFTEKNDSYIIYGELDPPTSPKTGTGTNLPANADLLKEGNIYIKIEKS